MLALLGVVVALVVAPWAGAPASAAPGDITVNNAVANEGAGTMVIEVVVETPHADMTATLSATNATAINGEDFTLSPQTVTLTAGVNTFSIPIIDDALDESTDTFSVQISNPSADVSLTFASGIMVIHDNDAEPTVSITSPASTVEGDSGQAPLVFEISLSAPSGRFVSVSFATANGTALAGSDYEAVSGTFNFVPGVTTMPLNVQLFGDLVYEDIQTFTVTLSSPVNASIAGVLGTGTILDNDAGPTLTVSGEQVSEFFDWASVTVTRTGGSEIPITVDYTTVNDSATAPGDYTATSGSLSFAPSTSSVVVQTVTVPIVDDGVIEPSESFSFALSNTVGANAGPAGTVTITDDDALPVLSIDDVLLPEGDSGTTAFTFTLSLDKPSTSTVSVQFATSDAGAVGGGSDYGTLLGTTTFSPGTVTETITVPVTGDTTFEGGQSFLVTLSSPLNATLGTDTGTGVILNDDPLPAFSISPASVSQPEGNAGGVDLTFTVTRSGATEIPASVEYATLAETATEGADFSGASGTLSFPASLDPAPTATFTVRVNGDMTRESAETFRLLLSNPTGAVVGADTAVVTITDDDAAGGGLAQTGPASSLPATLFGALLLVAAGTGVVIVGRRPSVAGGLLRLTRGDAA